MVCIKLNYYDFSYKIKKLKLHNQMLKLIITLIISNKTKVNNKIFNLLTA